MAEGVGGRVRRNIEVKAIDPDPVRSRRICQQHGARDEGWLYQRDIYFRVEHGRLKLREQAPGSAHLIRYERADERRQRESRYVIDQVEDPAATLAELRSAGGMLCVVTKLRRLFLWGQARIHLDVVAQLGTFIELEAVAAPGSDLKREHALTRELRDLLAISDRRIVAASYADMLLAGSPQS
ncbi:MAG TPA: class IV adenylate cyclase [Gaiellaceae bacterium]|nr:class IV adenylate cyclase [Gaiellaceae bacterium]